MIKKTQVGTLNGYEISVNESKMLVLSDWGCNVILLTLNGQSVLDTNTQFSDIVACTLSKSDFLIPFPNRVSGGQYVFEGKTYSLEVNEPTKGHAIHGLLRKKSFTLLESDIQAEYVALSLETTLKAGDNPGYPFDIHTVIELKLASSSLDIFVKTTNLGKTNAPYGVGWHPYLTLGKKINECMIQIPGGSELKLSTKHVLIPTGKKNNNIFGTNMKILGDQQFDTCFTDLTEDALQFGNIELYWDQKMEYLQIYTPELRDSIAVEPMSCAPDAFNNGMGLVTLHPKSEIIHSFGIRLR